VDEARGTIGRWLAAAEGRSELESSSELQELRVGYDEHGQEWDRVPMCAVDSAKVAATELEETYRHRLALARVTLSTGGCA
jgi:hypothetical protein